MGGDKPDQTPGGEVPPEAPKRVQLSRRKGWRMPPNTVKVDRTTRWGNLFIVGRDGTRAECVAKFYQLCRGFISFTEPYVTVDEQMAFYRRFRRSLRTLKGRDLACWCPHDGKPCHADVLLSFANAIALPAWAKRPLDLGRVRLGMLASNVARLERAKRKREAEAAEAVAAIARLCA